MKRPRRRWIRRCYVCERRYLPIRHGRHQLQAEDRRGTLVERPVSGHPDCLVRLAAFDPGSVHPYLWPEALFPGQRHTLKERTR